MKVRILNGDKSRSVMLIHGLYTNSGFWLNYIKYFENFKIFLLDIEYTLLDTEKSEYRSFVRKLSCSERVKFVIGHSFGALFLDYCGETSLTTVGINPPHYGYSKNNDFVDKVVSRYKHLEKTISSELNLVYTKIGTWSPENSILSRVVCSDNDEFFNFCKTHNHQNFSIVSGGHSEISEALHLICN